MLPTSMYIISNAFLSLMSSFTFLQTMPRLLPASSMTWQIYIFTISRMILPIAVKFVKLCQHRLRMSSYWPISVISLQYICHAQGRSLPLKAAKGVRSLYVLFVWTCLTYKLYFFNQRIVLFSHTKSANSIFSYDLSAKQAQTNRTIAPGAKKGTCS